MANGCDVKKQYSKDDFFDISLQLEFAEGDEFLIQDVYDEIRRNYDQVAAETIIRAIKDGTFNENWSMVPMDSPSSEPTQFNMNGAKNSETQLDDLLSYYLDKDNMLDARDRMAMRFFEDVISRVLYNKEDKAYLNPTTESVNEALYNYKVELLRSLWEYTGISHESELSPDDLTLVISRTLNDFVSKNKSTSVDKYYDDYVILKNFNRLLRDNAPFIKVNAAFAKTDYQAKDMYMWDPAGTYRQSWTDSEDSDISKTVSPLIRMLADYFTTEQGVPIGFKMYNIAMSTVAIWMHEHSSTDADAQSVSKDLRLKGTSADFGRMIDVYIAKAHPNEGLRQILEGIKTNIFNKVTTLPLKIRQAFANQFFITAKYAYVAYRQNYEAGDRQIHGQFLEDTFIDIKTNSLMKRVRDNVWMYRTQPKLFTSFKETHGITTYSQNGNIVIKFDKRYTTNGNGFTITIEQNGDTISFNKNADLAKWSNDSAMVTLIQDLLNELIPDDYEDILMAMSVSAPVQANLFDTFIEPICILLGASHDGGPEGNEDIFRYTETGDLIDWNFKNRYTQGGSFESIKDGINELNVLKNGEGNNLPVYQMAPAVFDIFTLIDDLWDAGRKIDASQMSMELESIVSKDKDTKLNFFVHRSVYGENMFIRTRELLKKMIVRSDVKIGNRVKSSDKLSVAEVMSLAIFNDFYQNLTTVDTDAKNPSEFAGNILLQPITYSDKKSHFLPLIDLHTIFEKISGEKKNYTAILRAIVNPNLSKSERKKYIDAIRKRIVLCRNDKVKKQISNQYLRFYSVFGNLDNYQGIDFETAAGKLTAEEARRLLTDKLERPAIVSDVKNFDEDKGFKYVAAILDRLNQFKNPLGIIRAMFKKQGALLSEDFDLLVLKGGKLQANEGLYFNYKIFNEKDSSRLDKYIATQQKYLALDLMENDFVMDEFDHPEMKVYMRSFNEKSGDYRKDDWYDGNAGIMKVARFFKDGKEIFPTQSDIEDSAFRHDPTITVELNPIIEGYFYANALFGDQINQIELGGTEGYVPKAKSTINFLLNDNTNDEKAIVDDILFTKIAPIMASRLANQFKRTTYEGAIKRKFALGLQFGVSSKIRSAIVEDEEVDISTLRGETYGQVTQDGAGFTMPTLHRMQQVSLVDSPVGTVKKTIAGWVDPRTGAQNHFKWAETTITMDLRQRSDKAERMYRKAYSGIDISFKFKGINNFDVYYNPNKNATPYKVSDQEITRTKPIYRYDIDSGNYYRLDKIGKTDDGIRMAWTLVDEHGTELNIPGIKSRFTIHQQIKTLYDFDQALGGRFTFELNEEGEMVPSEGVHDIIYNVVCTNDMKEDFVGYIVNHSAAKAGAVNMNPANIFDDDTTPLNTFYISSFGIGVQMDADHELDFASVTEMGQMISLLTQGGHNVELVNQAYADIGRVAAEAMRNILAAVNTDDNAIYRIIGKALLDTFDSGSREELGLAQAFIRNAQNAILKETGKDNIILPYSAESIRGSFVAAVTSLINKTGIRRKYAGFGAVQVPAEGLIQHYSINGIDYNYMAMREKIRPILQERGITWEQANSQVVINGELNPFLQSISVKDIDWEDTIILQRKGVDANGQPYPFSEPIKISNGKLFDKYRNLTDDFDYNVYRWTIKPKELTQSDLRFIIGEAALSGAIIEHTMSEFDIDPIRAILYINELIAYKEGKDNEWLENTERKINVIKAAITNGDLTAGGNQIADINHLEAFSTYFLMNLKKLCINKAQNYFNELSNIANGGTVGRLPVQMSTINDDVTRLNDELHPINQVVSPKLKRATAKVVLGRRNFKPFLLKKGDKLSTIKEKGADFFLERLIERDSVLNKVEKQIPVTRYDGVIHLANNDNIIILVGDQSDNLKHFNEKTHDFVVSDKSVSYKGQELFDDSKLEGVCSVKDLSFYSYIAADGQTLNVIHVPNYEAFNRIRNSEDVLSSRYNYNGYNFLDILRYKYSDKFDEQGNLKEEFEIQGVKINQSALNYTGLGTYIWEKLNGTEKTIRINSLKKKAEVLYRNFMQQLHYIQTRIPAQAMQSTMDIEVIDFADTDTNYIWVPKMVLLLQGSDFDIDKAYCMGYDINDSGNISCLSDLIKSMKYDIDDVLLLPTPKHGKITLTTSDPNAIDVTAQVDNLYNSGADNLQVLKFFIDLLDVQHPGENINVAYNGIFAERFNAVKEIIDDTNTHSASRRSEMEKEKALRNQVLAAARRIMRNPASQLNAYTPIAMVEPRKAAELNTSLGSKEKEMTLDNPASIFIMQKQNMSGKDVIAMTATGIKSYFIVTTYFNTLANQLNGLLQQYITRPDPEIGNKIVNILNEITFDGKLDTSGIVLRSFANINFYELKKTLQKLQETIGDQINYSEDYVENEANKAFKQYAHNGVLDIVDLINDLDARSNGNTWNIRYENLDSMAVKLSEITDETITSEDVKEMMTDQSVLSDFLSKYADKRSQILATLYSAYEYFTINAPDSLSALLSAATDNAKELILDKLNATSKFADIYTTLLSQGVPFIDIARMMTNAAFRIVARYSQDNIFDPSTSSFRIDNALQFVLNESQLYGVIPRGLFEAFLIDTSSVIKNKESNHKHNGFFNILKAIKINGTTPLADIIWDRFVEEGNLDSETIKRVGNKIAINQWDKLSKTEKLNRILITQSTQIPTSWRNYIAKVVLDLFNDTTSIIKSDNGDIRLSDYLIGELLHSLRTGIRAHNAAKPVFITNDPNDYLPNEDSYDDDIISVDDIDIDDETGEALQSYRTSDVKSWNSIGKKELIQIYRYVIKYFIPKTQSWNALSDLDKQKAKTDFKLLSEEVLYATKEMKMLGSFGSVNQGLKPKDFDEYKFIQNVNSFINRAYVQRGDKQINEEFDLIRFITETEQTEEDKRLNRKSYHDRHLDYYDKVKASVNILKAVDYTGNFKEMFKYIATNRSVIEHSVAIKLERKLASQLLHSVNIEHIQEGEGINKGATQMLSDKEFRVLSQYCRDLIVLNFFMGRHDLQMTVPAHEEYYTTDKTPTKYPILKKGGSSAPRSIVLDNPTDLATFKHLMDWYIIPRLKSDPRFADNAFLKNLIIDKVPDEKSKEPVISYKINVPLINIKDSPKAKQMYSRILADFNKLLYLPIDQGVEIGQEYGIGDWTIGNLFYMYNLLVNKDRIGQNAFTRLFEDLISSGNKHALAGEYYKYVSDLDKGEINIFNEDGTIDTDEFIYDMRDLQYRLSGFDRAKAKFAVSEEKSGRKVTEVKVFEKVDDQREIDSIEVSDYSPYISDFTLNMPFSTGTPAFLKPTQDYSQDFNAKQIITASSQTVFESLANEIANTYGKHIPMEIVTQEDIDAEFGDREDVNVLREANGFIIDGNIYLNVDKIDMGAPMHEIMHFIAAGMKFSDDPQIRSEYYKLLDWVTNWLDGRIKSGLATEEEVKLKEDLLNKNGAYGNRHMSDVKEEILVTLLAREFASKFGSIWGESRQISKDRIQATVKMVIAKMLNADEIVDLDFNHLGNESLLSVLKKFSSQILNADSSWSILISQNQEMADLKDFLVKNGYITLSKDCL